MAGHSGLQRFFVLCVARRFNTGHAENVIYRIDPVSGAIELLWFVGYSSSELAVAGDKLLVTDDTCFKEYSMDGSLLRVFDLQERDLPYLLRSSLHPDSTITLFHYNDLPLSTP